MLKHRVQGQHKRYQVDFLLPSRTKQSFKDISNINSIMAKYDRTGIVEHFSRYNGSYGDFTSCNDYQESIAKVHEANEMFMTLPASLRKRFDNDAASFLEFVGNPHNREEARNLGLLKPVEKDVAPSSSPKEA